MKKIGWELILSSMLLTGCGKQIPGNIIQPSQMKEILYDYHLVQSISGNLSTSDNAKKEAYKSYVFQKYNVTEAEFDSSMVWYTRNSEELSVIYEELSKRFNREKTRFEKLLTERDNRPTLSLYGDTVDVWKFEKLYWLTTNSVHNPLMFEIQTDTNFHAKDAFLWSADYIFLNGGKITIGLNVLFDNDSVMGKTETIFQTGRREIYLHTDSAFQIKSINGFIQIEADSITRNPSILVNDISLMRYHASNDSLTVTIPSENSETKQIKILEKDAPKLQEDR